MHQASVTRNNTDPLSAGSQLIRSIHKPTNHELPCSNITMKSTLIPGFIRVLSLICTISTALAQSSIEGCYSSPGPLKDQGSWQFQSQGYCKDLCTKLLKPVLATTRGSNCYCGDLLPPLSSKVPDSKCNTKCFGYDLETCQYTQLRLFLVLTSNVLKVVD